MGCCTECWWWWWLVCHWLKLVCDWGIVSTCCHSQPCVQAIYLCARRWWGDETCVRKERETKREHLSTNSFAFSMRVRKCTRKITFSNRRASNFSWADQQLPFIFGSITTISWYHPNPRGMILYIASMLLCSMNWWTKCRLNKPERGRIPS